MCTYRNNLIIVIQDIRLHIFYDNGVAKYMIELTERFTKANPDTSNNT